MGPHKSTSWFYYLLPQGCCQLWPYLRGEVSQDWVKRTAKSNVKHVTCFNDLSPNESCIKKRHIIVLVNNADYKSFLQFVLSVYGKLSHKTFEIIN